MRTIFTLLVLAFLTSSCSILKPAADAGLAAASFPECRAVWEGYMPIERQARVAAEYELLDSTYTSLISQVTTRPDITLTDALAKIAGAERTKLELEQAFEVIVTETVSYSLEIDERNEILISCQATVEKGWSGLFDNDAAAKASEFIRVYGPYAKLIPLLL